jgi:hypothetical protein
MDTHSTPNNKIRKARIRIVVYVLMLMILRAKTKACTMVKYKRSGSLNFMVSRFLFSIVTGFMQSWVLYKIGTGSLVLTLTVKDISWSLSCLAKHVAQVFYVTDTTIKRLMVVISGKQ